MLSLRLTGTAIAMAVHGLLLTIGNNSDPLPQQSHAAHSPDYTNIRVVQFPAVCCNTGMYSSF